MDHLNEFSNKLIEYLNGAEIFLKTQMPDFVNQFIAYEVWKCEWMFYFTLVILIVFIVAQAFNIIMLATDKYDGENGSIAFVVTGIGGTFLVIWCACCYVDLKKLEIAPKVYMIEQAKNLITGK